ncbi:hypothetical protein JQ625_06855 [Bradyrhizobium diazoefficiens]|nr:hypothetical protein [Bradyrhizobium diazoefficiens]MBR0774546.1 hypothetical protein [Bradyrhizobium diazoefficiens]
MKLEPQNLRDGLEAVALGNAAIQILIGRAVVVAICTLMAAAQELRAGISAAVGWRWRWSVPCLRPRPRSTPPRRPPPATGALRSRGRLFAV